MYARDCTCQHHNLTYDATLHVVRCLDCDSWQDIDDAWIGDLECDTFEAHYEESYKEYLKLNPDNEPTSEHMQYERTNKCTHQS